MLLVYIELKINKITIYITHVIDIIISIVSQIMGIHIPPWCLDNCAIRPLVWCVFHGSVMECLKLVSLNLDLQQFWKGWTTF